MFFALCPGSPPSTNNENEEQPSSRSADLHKAKQSSSYVIQQKHQRLANYATTEQLDSRQRATLRKQESSQTSAANLNEALSFDGSTRRLRRKYSDSEFVIVAQKEKDYFEKTQSIGLGDFEILGEIGRGAYGKVFEARRKGGEDIFAMKAIKFAEHVSRSVISHLQNEVSILSIITGEFLAKAYYSFVESKTLYIVMEYLRGGDFRSLLRREGRLELPAARWFIGQLVLAIESLHTHNVIHRDLKPENLLLDDRGRLKLADFGLSEFKSKLGCHDSSQPDQSQIEFIPRIGGQTGPRIVGTPDYIPPEVLFDKGSKRSESDISSIVNFDCKGSNNSLLGDRFDRTVYSR